MQTGRRGGSIVRRVAQQLDQGLKGARGIMTGGLVCHGGGGGCGGGGSGAAAEIAFRTFGLGAGALLSVCCVDNVAPLTMSSMTSWNSRVSRLFEPSSSACAFAIKPQHHAMQSRTPARHLCNQFVQQAFGKCCAIWAVGASHLVKDKLPGRAGVLPMRVRHLALEPVAAAARPCRTAASSTLLVESSPRLHIGRSKWRQCSAIEIAAEAIGLARVLSCRGGVHRPGLNLLVELGIAHAFTERLHHLPGFELRCHV